MEEEELPVLYPHSCITSLLLSAAAAAAAHGSFFLPLLLLLLVLVLVLALFIVEMGGTNIPISVPNPSINGRQLAMISAHFKSSISASLQALFTSHQS
jgi:hypothetical protein